jgi:dipeptidyl aminopeptidase/acylaminoacyl peptidase
MGLDVLGVLDAIRDRRLGDPGRVFLRGFSAGALLTTWVLGRVGADSPFRAATAHSWYPGEWGAPTYGAFQPRAYFDGPPWTRAHRDEATRRDPTMLLDRLATPLLLIHGESDHVTTLTEVETYYYAARTRPVEVAMAVFPGEGHWVGHHARNLRDRLLIEAGWYARHDRRA